MSLRVFAWDVDPIADPHVRSLYPLSTNRAEEFVSTGRARFLTLSNGRRAVQKLAPAEVLLERSARNCIVPYGRGAIGKIIAPPNLNYPVPAVADHRLSWLYSFMHAEKSASVPAYA